MKLCLITSNIRFDNPADGQHAWPLRREFLAQTLLQHNPDIIATQEGRFHQLKDLETLLPDFELVDPHRSWIKERMYPSFYLKKGQFEFCNSGDSWLSETPDVAGSLSFNSAFPRLMTWMKIQIKDTHKNLLVINTHLDHVKEETRKAQTKVLIQEIKKLWQENSYLIIMGDFNDNPDSEVRSILNEELHLTDAWKIFNSSEETSHHSFKGELEYGTRIDWIMTDSRLKLEKCLMDKNQRDGLYPSDHFPIVCEIKF
jgi:endonuclease/exonuclease/phosphatase family metal-dependent hydrolase